MARCDDLKNAVGALALLKEDDPSYDAKLEVLTAAYDQQADDGVVGEMKMREATRLARAKVQQVKVTAVTARVDLECT